MSAVLSRALAATLALAALPAAAQDAGSRATREFVAAAGASDTFEMREAQSALAGATDPRVRAYAQMMLRDHAATSRALTDATAEERLAPPPMQVDTGQARLLAELQSSVGPAFDRAYARHQAFAHRAALTTEQQYAATGDDPALRRVAADATGVITAHLQAAEQLKTALGE